MTALYVLNLIAAVGLLFVPLWFSRRYLGLPFLNPFTIVLAIGLPVQLMKLFAGPMLLIEDGGLFEGGYQFALLMGNLLVVAQTAGMFFFYRVFCTLRIERHFPLQNAIVRPRDARRAARLFLLIFAFALFWLADAEFGVMSWLANPREGYQLYRSGQGHWYAIATSALAASFVLYFLARPTARALLLQTAAFLGLGYFLGSKFTLLSIFTAALVFLWFIRWPYLIRMMIVGAPLVFVLLVWNLYLALGDTFEIQSIVEYFDYYKNAADYYREYLLGNIPLFYGDVTWTSLWSYVPRAIWPEKPFVYGILLINEIFFPGAAELTNTPAFGGAVEQFADFGVPGLLLFGFFGAQSVSTALLSYLTFRRPGIHFERVSLATILLLLVQFAPAFGIYVPGMLYLLLLGICLLLTAAVRTAPRGPRFRATRRPAPP